MTKEKFVRKNVPASRLEEIAGNCNGTKALTTTAVCMVSETLEKMFKAHKEPTHAQKRQ